MPYGPGQSTHMMFFFMSVLLCSDFMQSSKSYGIASSTAGELQCGVLIRRIRCLLQISRLLQPHLLTRRNMSQII